MDNIQEIALDKITASFGNDRTTFDDSALRALADSIAANGLAQPVTVRPVGDGYQLIAGERRYRAHKLLGMATIRAIVTELSDERAAQIMLSENTARKDLDPIDEAQAYARRMREYAWTDKQCADKAGVNVQTVRNRIALLSLREDIQFLVRSGNLQLGYANIISEAELDSNRQLIALKRLNECPAPTPTWLRKQCAELAEAQASNDMFDNVLFQAADFSAKQTKQAFEQKLPADPKGKRKEDQAPVIGKTYRQMIENQVKFWLAAGDAWDRYGKSAPRDRCLAAAASLQAVVALMPQHGHKGRKFTKDSQEFVVYQAG